MEQEFDVNAFKHLLGQKQREIVYTKHAIVRARSRKIISDVEDTIKSFETDIHHREPHMVVELDSERIDERKFKAYYHSKWGYMGYVISIDGQITVITILNVSKRRQDKLYKYSKRSRGGSHENRY
jgi:hypothetical protein